MKGSRQQEFEFRTHGGKRKGAGRKPASGRKNVPHRTRPLVKRYHGQHITLRLHPEVGRVRSERAVHILYRKISAGCERFGTRIVYVSIQDDHIHFVAEADSKLALTRSMKGVGGRIARGLNKLLGRRGTVIADRYHARALRSPMEVKGAIAYVLKNRLHHEDARFLPRGWVDPYSSAYVFDGWVTKPSARFRPLIPPPILTSPQSWLVSIGWRTKGLIPIEVAPPPMN